MKRIIMLIFILIYTIGVGFVSPSVSEAVTDGMISLDEENPGGNTAIMIETKFDSLDVVVQPTTGIPIEISSLGVTTGPLSMAIDNNSSLPVVIEEARYSSNLGDGDTWNLVDFEGLTNGSMGSKIFYAQMEELSFFELDHSVETPVTDGATVHLNQVGEPNTDFKGTALLTAIPSLKDFSIPADQKLKMEISYPYKSPIQAEAATEQSGGQFSFIFQLVED